MRRREFLLGMLVLPVGLLFTSRETKKEGVIMHGLGGNYSHKGTFLLNPTGEIVLPKKMVAKWHKDSLMEKI